MLSLDEEVDAPQWEVRAYGSTSQDRTVNVGQEALAWKARAGYKPTKKKHVMQMMVRIAIVLYVLRLCCSLYCGDDGMHVMQMMTLCSVVSMHSDLV